MENNNQIGKPLITSASILAAAFIVAAIVCGVTVYKIRLANDVITVTGSAKQSVVSDSAKWTAIVTRTVRVSGLKAGYAGLDNDTKAVKAFLAGKGYSENDYTLSPVFMNENYDYSANRDPNAEKQYNLTETLTLSSPDVEKLTSVVKDSGSLASNGVLLSTQSLEYFYSKLADLRVSLLGDAVADAKARASKLAEAGGSKVGGLKSASSGVVQVTSPNSVEVADYGSYDTGSIQKDVMVTVKASFSLR